MKKYDDKINDYIARNNISLERMIFDEPIYSSELSSKKTGADEKSNVKTVLFMDKSKEVYAVIIRCIDRVDISKLKNAYNVQKIQSVPSSDVENLTGYPAGGIPPFGYDARFVISDDLSDDEIVFAGGGTPYSLIKIKVSEIKKASGATSYDIRKITEGKNEF